MLLTPTRQFGLEKLQKFAPLAGLDYASYRNFDLPNEGHPHVSNLSPYLRHRMISEQEVICAVLEHNSNEGAQKFIQEVYWRTYWKGWLEQRPQVWEQYKTGVSAAINRLQTEAGFRARFDEACTGETDLDYFNYWSQTLVKNGYLHNHARMWFASIWIFTLRLPWELGADFFLRHLLDGDPASNTLSWRWVAGLHTKGKTYLARPDNIAKYTKQRFQPKQEELSMNDDPIAGAENPVPNMPALTTQIPSDTTCGLLITEEDLNPEFLFAKGLISTTSATLLATSNRSPLIVSPLVSSFSHHAAQDTHARFSEISGTSNTLTTSDPAQISLWAKSNGFKALVTSYVPTGPTRDALRQIEDMGIPVHQIARDYDVNAWPYATAGFFKFRKKIPELTSLFK